MRILHISDMHYSKENEESFELNLIKPMLEDLKLMAKEKEFDFVVFSGDMVDKGGKSFDNDLMLGLLEFESKVITPILETLELVKNRFIMVPGNHDIERTKDNPYMEIGLVEKLKNYDEVYQFMENKRNKDNDWEGILRIQSYKEFEKNFYDLDNIQKFEVIHTLEINNQKVGIAAFNTSWRCFDENDKGRIILGESQINNALRKFQENKCDLKIAILHHPIDEIHEFEMSEIQNILSREFDFIFTGHVHFNDSQVLNNFHGKTFISKAPANWSGNIKSTDVNYLNGYSILDYNLRGEIVLKYRRYSNFKNQFIANTDRGNERGEVLYNFPSSIQVGIVEKKREILEVIQDYHLEDINNHLLTFNTDTFAPKSLEELFVSPKLTFKKEVDVDSSYKRVKDEEVKYKDLLTSEENFVIFGTRESGKTILLDKLLLDFVDTKNNYESIPIFISFKEIQQNNNIDVLVSRYLHEPIKDLRAGSLDEVNKVLLIDNIDFNDVRKVNSLKDFLENHKNYRFIATSNSTGDNEIPASALKSELSKICNTLFINQFQTKEIKELLTKWFSKRDEVTPSEKKLEKILETFKSLNLPRTPMAVSMFLWIIEKQENYVPINNAQMLENFLEKVFSKSNVTEVKSSDFNYKNKETLLTEIAYFMYEKNDVFYRVEQSELVEFIRQRLKTRMYPFDAIEILEDFLKKGIFSKQQENLDIFIIFKFSCFYHYYLMRNIRRKPEFRKLILEGENVIHFMEEIEYYTGINMEDTEMFNVILYKMEEKFNSISEQFGSKNKLDSYYETDKNFIEYIKQEELNTMLLESKETETDYEKNQDDYLEESNDIIQNKSVEINFLEKYERYWVLAAKVIKNSEEIEEAEIRIKAIRSTISCSVLYMTMYKTFIKILEERLSRYIDDELREQIFILDKLLPVFQQIIVTQTIGTGKLIIPIEQILDDILSKTDTSEIEKFVYLFLYSDLKGENYKKYIDEFILNFKSWYMRDMVFTKLFEYYIRKDTPKEDEKYLSNHMADLIEASKGSKKHLNEKGKIISKLEDMKLEMSLKSS